MPHRGPYDPGRDCQAPDQPPVEFSSLSERHRQIFEQLRRLLELTGLRAHRDIAGDHHQVGFFIGEYGHHLVDSAFHRLIDLAGSDMKVSDMQDAYRRTVCGLRFHAQSLSLAYAVAWPGPNGRSSQSVLRKPRLRTLSPVCRCALRVDFAERRTTQLGSARKLMPGIRPICRLL